MQDEFGRTINYLRISVTDRCNLRCIYCMPEEGVDSLSHTEILSYEEILRLVKCFSKLGITKVRLTGGEPLVRRDIESLIKDIKDIGNIDTVSITTNGILLPEKFEVLKASGLDSVNISLDTLDSEKFDFITRRTGLNNVLSAINLCEKNGINTKINCVPMKGINENELLSIARMAKDKNVCVRFIEYMPIGKNDYEKAVSSEDLKILFESEFGPMQPDNQKHGNGPAVYFKPDNFTGSIGLISAMSNCFCESCNRVRLTAEGFLKLCLQYDTGIDLRELLRNDSSDEKIINAISEAIMRKPRKHTFNDYTSAENIEEKGMSRIGG